MSRHRPQRPFACPTAYLARGGIPACSGLPRAAIITLCLAVLACLGSLSIGTAQSAQAHAALRSSNPADGSVVTNLPPTAELVFNEDIDINLAAQLVLADAAGVTARLEDVSVRGPSVSAPLPRGLPAGTTVLRYRVVSADSHPIAGEITFEYRPVPTAGATPPPSGATSSGATTSGTGNSDTGASAAGTSGGVAPSASAPATDAAAPAAPPSNDGAFTMLALGGVGALVFGVIVFLLVRSDHGRR